MSYNCPAGTTTLPAPSYSSWGAWADTGVTRNQVNTCTNCPAPSTQTQTRWVATSAACPAGQTGSNTWEREQASTRSVSYNCPAGTTALPPATLGGWGAWTDTGATRNVNNTCAPPAGQSCQVDWQTGVLDTRDAYYTIDYTVNGVQGGCSATRNADGLNGATNCNGGSNGVLDQGTWETVAEIGDYYSTSGSQSGWGASGGEFWGWDSYTWQKMTTCPSNGSFDVISESCAAETHQNTQSLAQAAYWACNGAPVGSEPGAIHHFPQYQIGCYTTIRCK